MVADKSKSHINLNSAQFECGDGSRILSNLNTSSSDESTKCKSDDENRMDQSLDSSAKDESDDDSKNLDKTYLCTRSKIVCDYSGDAKLENINNSSKLDNSYSDGNVDSSINCSSPKTWKSRNVFSLSKHFDETETSCKLCDIKSENLTTQNLKTFDEMKKESLLIRTRNYLAEYQELRGTSREEYTYFTLIKSMGQAIGQCLISIFYVMINIAPILEIILHIMRFIFDKIIDIKKTTEFRNVLMKTIIFCVEISSIYICLIFIFGLIVSPIINMTYGIFSKIMLYE